MNNRNTSEVLAHQFICNEDDPVKTYTLVRGLQPPFKQLISCNQGRGRGIVRRLNDFVLGHGKWQLHNAEQTCSRFRVMHPLDTQACYVFDCDLSLRRNTSLYLGGTGPILGLEIRYFSVVFPHYPQYFQAYAGMSD
jgi:hypothetical protein